MARRNKTFSSDDIVRIFHENLTLIEQNDVLRRLRVDIPNKRPIFEIVFQLVTGPVDMVGKVFELMEAIGIIPVEEFRLDLRRRGIDA